MSPLARHFATTSMSACLHDFANAGRPGVQAWQVDALKAVQIMTPQSSDELGAGAVGRHKDERACALHGT